MQNMLKKLLFSSWILVLALLFLYSFTQVDLGLTLNRSSVITDIQKSFQYIGYFNRPVSAMLAGSLFVLLGALYILTLYLVWHKKISSRVIWAFTFLTSVILFFSYNAFSYDLFNYMFDAKIITEYGQNPYFKKALDFPDDPYLGFMHWTHRTYPYGPVWLVLTVPFSLAGMQIFILTFYLFKLLVIASYIACSYLIYRIAKGRKIVSPAFALAFFSLNPLVIIEGLVSAHHDLVMMVFALLGIYFLLQKKNVYSWIFLIISIGVKFATTLLLPLFFWYPFSRRKNKEELFFHLSVFLMVGAIILASQRTTFQPWYLLFALPFASFVSYKYYILIPFVIISFLVPFQYIPFLYSGNFDPPIPTLMDEMLISSIAAAGVITVGYSLLKKAKKR